MKTKRKYRRQKGKKHENIKRNKKYILYIFFVLFIILLLLFILCFIFNIKSRKYCKNYCYTPLSNPNIKIIHVIITRFFLPVKSNYIKNIKAEDFEQNSKRVLNKYLLPSLEKQKCKNFIWVLRIGDTENITHIKSFFNFKNSFKTELIYERDMKNYLRNIVIGYDVLITTRIDYDDIIYYDAVNDARKKIDLNKPLILHGYYKGYHYFESDGKYYDFYDTFGNNGVMSIFISLITCLNKVNDEYYIYELGDHTKIKSTFLRMYKSFGVKEINYDPFQFDNSTQRFVWIRQKYSGALYITNRLKKTFKLVDFNPSKIYDKCNYETNFID